MSRCRQSTVARADIGLAPSEVGLCGSGTIFELYVTILQIIIIIIMHKEENSHLESRAVQMKSDRPAVEGLASVCDKYTSRKCNTDSLYRNYHYYE